MRRVEHLILLASALLVAPRAHAHPAAAEPPIYGKEPCIITIDAGTTELWSSPYMVAYDDTLLEDGDIRLPDAKTHQFFALRGDVLMNATGFELVAFESSGDDAAEQRIALPFWINAGDVERAAAAVDGSGTMFTAADVPQEAILANQLELTERALRIDADDARRPITSASAERGITFAPSALPPGLYTIAAYIFSPPFNGWAPRPGILNVVSAEHRAPAALLEPIASVVRPTQGRRVRACIAAPEGTTVRGSFRVLERPELGWQEWLAEQPLPHDTDHFERCFHNPDPQLTGSLRLRLELRAPDGTVIATHSPDTLTAINGAGACQPSEQVCCEVAAPEAPSAPPTQAAPASCSTSLTKDGTAAHHATAALAFLALCRVKSRRRRHIAAERRH